MKNMWTHQKLLFKIKFNISSIGLLRAGLMHEGQKASSGLETASSHPRIKGVFI